MYLILALLFETFAPPKGNEDCYSPGGVIIQNRPFRQAQMGTVFQYGHMGTPTEYYCSHMALLEQKSKWRLFPYHHMGTTAI